MKRLSLTLRARTYVTTVLVLAVAALGAFSWEQYSRVVALRSRLLDGQDRAALEAQLAALKRLNRDLEARLHIGGPHAGTSGTAPGGAAAAALGSDGVKLVAGASTDSAKDPLESRRDAMLDLLSALADMPEFQKLLATEQRAAVDSKYAALFRRLHLPPGQQQQLASLLAEKQSAFADALVAAHDQGLDGSDARKAALAVARATNSQVDSSIMDLLGSQGYKQYQNFERTMPQRETVNQLAQRLSYTSTPLTPGQQDRLVQTLATTMHQQVVAEAAAARATGQPAPHPAVIVPPLPGALGSIGASKTAVITSAAVVSAQKFLSTQQLDALSRMQQEQQAQLKLGQLIRTGVKNPAPAPRKSGKG